MKNNIYTIKGTRQGEEWDFVCCGDEIVDDIFPFLAETPEPKPHLIDCEICGTKIQPHNIVIVDSLMLFWANIEAQRRDEPKIILCPECNKTYILEQLY